MNTPHVYDKAKYHYETIEQHGLSSEHAANHTIMFLRWLIDRRMMSSWFESEAEEVLKRFRAGEISIHEVYQWWDCCLVDDMLADEGNAFSMHYFDFEHGRYLNDYIEKLQGRLPSEFHVEYTEDNYQKMRQVIDRRYDEWKSKSGTTAGPDLAPRKKTWWRLW